MPFHQFDFSVNLLCFGYWNEVFDCRSSWQSNHLRARRFHGDTPLAPACICGILMHRLSWTAFIIIQSFLIFASEPILIPDSAILSIIIIYRYRCLFGSWMTGCRYCTRQQFPAYSRDCPISAWSLRLSILFGCPTTNSFLILFNWFQLKGSIFLNVEDSNWITMRQWLYRYWLGSSRFTTPTHFAIILWHLSWQSSPSTPGLFMPK